MDECHEANQPISIIVFSYLFEHYRVWVITCLTNCESDVYFNKISIVIATCSLSHTIDGNQHGVPCLHISDTKTCAHRPKPESLGDKLWLPMEPCTSMRSGVFHISIHLAADFCSKMDSYKAMLRFPMSCKHWVFTVILYKSWVCCRFWTSKGIIMWNTSDHSIGQYYHILSSLLTVYRANIFKDTKTRIFLSKKSQACPQLRGTIRVTIIFTGWWLYKFRKIIRESVSAQVVWFIDTKINYNDYHYWQIQSCVLSSIDQRCLVYKHHSNRQN